MKKIEKAIPAEDSEESLYFLKEVRRK